ncbi:MAG: cysteine--tRNA ligase [Coprothermobacterota bacterium]|nr:cysteine--tRNA ligase [Coprothermobacterota bacterium]
MIRLYNTATRQKETFEPLLPGRISMYTCGPTVYNFPHIGNWRTFLFEDLLRRTFELLGYKVTQVMNLTDVEDKIIRASLERSVPIEEITAPFIEAFFKDLDILRVERAEHYPRATGHIPQMIALIETLLAKGYAYKLDGSVYYAIDKFPRYGRLSRIKASEDRSYSRLVEDEYEKEQITDFALWKAAKEGEPAWPSPFGLGRPGWHIECSAMSMAYLGTTFDIHTGGIDNMFPHHENEIAQSEGATGQTFARVWLHSNHLMVDGQRMAKSRGNFYTLGDLLTQGFSPLAIRFLLLSTHYRNTLNFTLEGLRQAEHSVERLQDFYHRLQEYTPPVIVGMEPAKAGILEGIRSHDLEFKHALADDLNISGALSATHGLMHEVNPLLLDGRLVADEAEAALVTLRDFDRVLVILEEKEQSEDWILEGIEERRAAREKKDFASADRIRGELEEKGILLEDGSQGTRWRRKVS